MAFRPIAYGMYTCRCSLGMPYTPTSKLLLSPLQVLQI